MLERIIKYIPPNLKRNKVCRYLYRIFAACISFSGEEDIRLLGKAYLEKEAIKTIPSIGYDEYRKCCPPLFEKKTPMPPLTEYEREASIQDASMNLYFHIEKIGDNYYITDDYPGSEQYYMKQRMLLSAYRYFLGDDFNGLSLLDVAGSSGYLSLLASRLGFKNVLCVEGRSHNKVHFEILRRMLSLEGEFRVLNVERLEGQVTDKFDVVIAAGILYHLYDQASFIKSLHTVTGKLLIINTFLNGRMDMQLAMMHEDLMYTRDSPFSQISLAPSLPVVVELLRNAGFKEIYVVPLPEDVKDTISYGAYREIMLAALV